MHGSPPKVLWLFLVLGDLLIQKLAHATLAPLGKSKKFKMAAKMAAANVKNYKIVTTSLLIHLETYFLHLGIGFGTQAS